MATMQIWHVLLSKIFESIRDYYKLFKECRKFLKSTEKENLSYYFYPDKNFRINMKYKKDKRNFTAISI